MSPELREVPSSEWRPRPCSCRTWGLLNPFAREMLLGDLMEWAVLLHQVQLKLLLRGEHVIIGGLLPKRPGRGRSRVLHDLLSWSDCALVVLELTPSKRFGSDVDRLTKVFAALGFEPNREPPGYGLAQEAMIRYSKPCQCQPRF